MSLLSENSALLVQTSATSDNEPGTQPEDETHLSPGDVAAAPAHGADDTDDDVGEIMTSSTTASSSQRLFLCCIFYVITSVLNFLLYHAANDALGEYLNFARGQIGVFTYDIFVTIAVVAAFLLHRCKMPVVTPLYYFVAVGFIDATGDFLSTAAANQTSGPLQTLLSQLTIPSTLFWSWLLLKHSRFTPTQIIGAVVVIAGCCIASIPQFEKPDDSSSATRWGPYIFAFAQLGPEGISSVLKNKIFQREREDGGRPLFVLLLSMLVSWSQLAWTWVYLPLESISIFGGVALDDVGPMLERGFQCLAGEAPLQNPTATPNSTGFGVRCRSGAYVSVVTVLFAAVGLVNTFFGYLILDHPRGGAALNAILSAFCIPISSLAYSINWSFLWAKPHEITVYDGISLAVTFVGVLLYQFSVLRKRFCADSAEEWWARC